MTREIVNIMKITGNGKKFGLLLLLRAPFDITSTLVYATFLQRGFDAALSGDSAGLSYACALFSVACLCLFLYNGTVWSIYASFVTRIEAILRVKLFEKIASFSCERVESVLRGDWITRLNTDVEMPFSRPLHLPHAACGLLNLTLSAVFLWHSNAAVFGWVLLFVIPHVAVIHLFIASAMPELNRKSLEAMARNTAELTSFIECADISALYGGRDYLLKRFENSSIALLKANTRIHVRDALGAGLLPLFGLGGYLVLLIISAGWINAGGLTFGDLTAAFQLRGGVLKGAFMLINSLISIQASMAGIRRLNETMLEEAG